MGRLLTFLLRCIRSKKDPSLENTLTGFGLAGAVDVLGVLGVTAPEVAPGAGDPGNAALDELGDSALAAEGVPDIEDGVDMFVFSFKWFEAAGGLEVGGRGRSGMKRIRKRREAAFKTFLADACTFQRWTLTPRLG